jgi:hypothetical protein
LLKAAGDRQLQLEEYEEAGIKYPDFEGFFLFSLRAKVNIGILTMIINIIIIS